MDLMYINADRIILLRTGERTQRGEIVSLARSIGKLGLLVPLTVRKIEHTDKYELISGVKRFYACRMARISRIPVFITSVTPSLARLTAKKGERQDYFEEAELLRSAVLDSGMSAEELSCSCGYNSQEIIGMLRLTKMTEIEKEMARKNNVSRETLTEIAACDDVLKRTEILSIVINSRLCTAEAVKLMDKKLNRRANRTPKFKDIRIFDNTVNKAVAMLKEVGVKAEIESDRQNSGVEYKIRIEN